MLYVRIVGKKSCHRAITSMDFALIFTGMINKPTNKEDKMTNKSFSKILMVFVSCGLCAINCAYADNAAPSAPAQQPPQTQQPQNPHEPLHSGPKPAINLTPTKGGQLLTSPEGHFSVVIPSGFGDIDAESQVVDTDVGAINTFNFSASSQDSTYIVGSSEYPKDIIASIKGKEQEIFDGAQEGLLMHMKGKVLAKNDLSIDGHKARTVDFSANVDNETLYGKLELILAEPRLVHLLYITNKKEELDGEGARGFFSTIKITDDQAQPTTNQAK